MTMENGSGVYTIVNFESGKVYVGSAASLRLRWNSHRSLLQRGAHGNPHLQASWDKYGSHVFEFLVCEYVKNPGVLRKREQYWLDYFRLLVDVYNIALITACPTKGRRLSESTRRKMSEAHKGRAREGYSVSTSARRKMSEAQKGHSVSEDTRRKISKARMGQRLSEEHRRKIGESLKGHSLSDEGKQKIRETRSKPYPAFVHNETGEVIPAGYNLKAVCQEHGLRPSEMYGLKNGKRHSHRGWQVMRCKT